jgi:AcrR family transcriptional regulator
MSPRGKSQNEHMRDAALAKIEGAALKIFAEYGYHGATMRQITHATGLSYGLVYHYFPSKAKIFRHILEYALQSPMAALNQALDGPGTAWERIENLSALLAQNAFSGESSRYFLFVLHALTQGKGIPGLAGLMEKFITAYYEKLVPVIIQAQKTGQAAKGDPEALAAAYFSLVQGLALLAFQGKGLEKKITPDILSNVVRNSGLRA